MSTARRVGIVGARGHVGAELIRLIAAHPRLRAARSCPRASAKGSCVAEHDAGVSRRPALQRAGATNDCRRSAPTRWCWRCRTARPRRAWRRSIAPASDPVIVDLSADYRFDRRLVLRPAGTHPRAVRGPAPHQQSRLLRHGDAAGDRADAAMLLDGPVQCFGVSGYSGAGTTPSDKNDPDKLRDNLMPYALTGHVHEREVTRQLGHRGRIHAARRAAFPRPDDHREPAPARGRSTATRCSRAIASATPANRWCASSTRRRGSAASPARHHVELGGFTLSDDGRRAGRGRHRGQPAQGRGDAGAAEPQPGVRLRRDSPASPLRSGRAHERPVVAEARRHGRRAHPGASSPATT